MRATSLAMLAVLAWPSGSAGGEGKSELFRYHELHLSGEVRDHVVADLDGDGLLDLAIVLASEDDSETVFDLRTCLQTAERGFAGDCGQTRIPRQVRAFDIGEVDGRRGAELVAITDEGVRVASFEDGAFGKLGPLVRVNTILEGSEPLEPVRLRFLSDVNDDERDDLILPTLAGPAIYGDAVTGLALLQQIDSPARLTYQMGQEPGKDVNRYVHRFTARTQANYTAPDVFTEDFDGDGRLDLITLVGTSLKVFLQDESGAFASSASAEFDRSILPPDERDNPLAGEALTFKDLNGDGMSDIIAMKWGTSEERTRIDRYIYYARSGIRYPEKPDQVIRSEAAWASFSISDLNNDGRVDLVVPYFHFAPSQAFKLVTQSEVKLQFRLFLMGADGRYSQDPGKAFAKVDRRVSLDFEVDVLGMLFGRKSRTAGTFNPLISFDADVNGDGFRDLIADTGKGKLAFYWGNDAARYSRRPDHVIRYESAVDFDLVDLNRDGKTDILTYYANKDRDQPPASSERSAESGRRPEKTPSARNPRSQPPGPKVKILLSR